MTLTVASLFAGVEGIGLGMERAGCQVVAAVELNKAARGVIADHFPGVALFTDVTKVTADDLLTAGFQPHRGILAAGFPCQDLSIAGRRHGMGAGTRSGLYWHVVRLMVELAPRWVVLENVPGLLSAVCPCTGDGACGTDDCPGKQHTVAGGACGPGQCMGQHGGAMGAVLGSLADSGYGWAYRVLDAQHFGVPQRRPRVVIVGNLGNLTRPVEILFEPESSSRGATQVSPQGQGPAHALAGSPDRGGLNDTELGHAVTGKWAKGTGGPAGQEYQNLVVSALQGGGKRGQRVDAEGAKGGHLLTYQKVIRPQTSDHPDVWEHRDTAATLSPFDLGSDTRAVELVASDVAVRRLTPLECERLQGFPDNWTATSWGKPQKDGPRYRQLGNAVAVPVFEWLAHRIVERAQP